MSWIKQSNSSLLSDYHLMALDLRGHGRSEKSNDRNAYVDGKLWAADINNVISHLKPHAPVLVGWSYGGLMICDYL